MLNLRQCCDDSVSLFTHSLRFLTNCILVASCIKHKSEHQQQSQMSPTQSTADSPNCKRRARPLYGEHLTLPGAPETSRTQFVFFGCFYLVMIWILVQHGDVIWEGTLRVCNNSPYHATFTLLSLDLVFFWVYGGILAIFELSKWGSSSASILSMLMQLADSA